MHRSGPTQVCPHRRIFHAIEKARGYMKPLCFKVFQTIHTPNRSREQLEQRRRVCKQPFDWKYNMRRIISTNSKTQGPAWGEKSQ